jgi:quercetin dioxygenase-like cupin family protein
MEDRVSETYRVDIESVEPVPGLVRDDGWVGMTVQFLVEHERAGSEHVVFGRARFAPGNSEHQWHRHPGAEEFLLLTRGEGIVLDGDNEIPVRPGDIVFHRKGEWHGFRNASQTEEAEVIWGWGGASSKEEAGYELRYEPDKEQR